MTAFRHSSETSVLNASCLFNLVPWHRSVSLLSLAVSIDSSEFNHGTYSVRNSIVIALEYI